MKTLALFLFALLATLAILPDAARAASPLDGFLAEIAPADLIAGADGFGAPQGEPPVVPVLRGGEVVGYAFLNADFVDSTGYSGKPIRVVIAIDGEGTIRAAKLVEHHEPIVLIGIPEARVLEFMAAYVGYNPLQAAADSQSAPEVDIVSGATVTVLVIGDSIVRSAARAARRIGIGGDGTAGASAGEPRWVIDPAAGEITDWQTLLGDGSVRRLSLSVGDVNEAFRNSGNAKATAKPERGQPEDAFIDLYAALVSQPAIGRSLLGEAEYAALQKMLAPGQQAVLVAGEGRYSFKGSGYVRGGIFDRIELIQGTETIRFRDKLHRRIGNIAAEGAPDFPEIGVFIVPEGVDFDPAQPWRLQLLVQRSIGAIDKAFTTFELGYQLPEHYRKRVEAQQVAAEADAAAPAPADTTETEAAELTTAGTAPGEDTPLWQRIWKSKAVSIGILGAMLIALTLIFFFQDWLVKRPVLFDRIRLGYLAVTLFWLGWVAQAQLSVVNVLAFANSLRTDFQWSYFLVDPLIFILWFSVAAALLFWGRGPFCGWLCPFGALQELSNRVAKLLKVPQIFVPWWLHERLWPIKYIVFLVLFGISLGSLAFAEQLAEIEPFKTAIILRFMRDWWFVLFALSLVVAGLFIERFFCRYLCPLGAALAIPGRLRMFDWLKRYRECGNPCMRCHNECPVQAIHPEGHINPNECISCLHCQVLYHHDQKCPVMIQRRIKREKRQGLASPGIGPGASGQPARARAAPEPATGAVPAPTP